MPLTRKRATIWGASDGSEFRNIEEAVSHESWLRFRASIQEALQESYDDAIAVKLWQHRIYIYDAIGLTKTRFKQEASPANVEFKPGELFDVVEGADTIAARHYEEIVR